MNYRGIYLVATLAAFGASSPISFAAGDEPPQGGQQQAELMPIRYADPPQSSAPRAGTLPRPGDGLPGSYETVINVGASSNGS